MTTEVLVDHGAVASRVAELLAEDIAGAPRVLGLPTGRTMTGVYQELTRRTVDWTRVRTFNLDEFAGIGASHPGSFRAYMDEHFFRRVALPPAAIEFLRGDAADLDAECRRYEAALAAAGGLDLACLGMGTNGHIGFNEPGDLQAATHLVDLHESTRRANAARFGGDWTRVPARALTIGMRCLLQTRRIVVAATGASKAGAVAASVQGPLTTRCPASWLQVHPDVTLVVDVDAASELTC